MVSSKTSLPQYEGVEEMVGSQGKDVHGPLGSACSSDYEQLPVHGVGHYIQ